MKKLLIIALSTVLTIPVFAENNNQLSQDTEEVCVVEKLSKKDKCLYFDSGWQTLGQVTATKGNEKVYGYLSVRFFGDIFYYRITIDHESYLVLRTPGNMSLNGNGMFYIDGEGPYFLRVPNW